MIHSRIGYRITNTNMLLLAYVPDPTDRDCTNDVAFRASAILTAAKYSAADSGKIVHFRKEA